MSLYPKISGQIKKIIRLFMKEGGLLKELSELHAPSQGVDKVIFRNEPPKPLTIVTERLSVGTAHEECSAQLKATGGSGWGYKWQLMEGSLTPGLTMSETGLISGTPAKSGSVGGLNFMVTDSKGNTCRRYVQLSIKAKAVSFLITGNRHQYDGLPHTCNVYARESAITADDFTVTYDGKPAQTEVGSYILTITANASMKRKGYKVGSYSPRMLQIVPAK